MDNNFLDIERKMKQDSIDRDRIMEEVVKNLDVHNRRLVEYGQKAKHLDVLEVKYNNLMKESKEIIRVMQIKVEKLTSTNANLENEIMLLKRNAVGMKNKMTGLRSALELVIGDFGIEQVALATGLDKDKLKEYLKD